MEKKFAMIDDEALESVTGGAAVMRTEEESTTEDTGSGSLSASSDAADAIHVKS